MLTEPSLRKKIVLAGFWATGSSYILFGLNFVCNIFVARFMGPEPYGIYVFAATLQAISGLLIVLPISLSLIRSDGSQRVFDAAWIISLLTGILSCFVGLIGGLAVWYRFGEQSATIFFILCCAQLPQILATTHLAYYEKKMNFKMVSTISGISSSGGAVAALLAAWYGAGVWSLLARDIVPSFVLWFLVWRFVNVRFSGNWNRTDCIKLLHESMKFNISRILEVGFFRAPFIFIGQIFGQVSLGLFSQGFYLASLPNVFLGPISERVAFAGYAMVSGDTDKISRGLFMANFLIIRLAAPIGMGIFLFGDQVIYLLYGQKWHLAGEIFSALGLFSAINILFTHVKTACLGIGKRNFVNHAYLLLVSGLALIIQISSQLGSIKYLSVGYGVAMTIGLAYMLIRLHRHGINLRLTELLFLPLLYSVVVLVLVYVEKVELTTNAHDLFYLIAITVMYPVLVLVFEGKKIRQVLRPRT